MREILCLRSFDLSTGCVTALAIVSTIRCMRPARLWSLVNEVEGTLTHADAPQRGNAPHPACVYHFTIDTHEIILSECYACGPIPRA
jgi:hypothetical protein